MGDVVVGDGVSLTKCTLGERVKISPNVSLEKVRIHKQVVDNNNNNNNENNENNDENNENNDDENNDENNDNNNNNDGNGDGNGEGERKKKMKAINS